MKGRKGEGEKGRKGAGKKKLAREYVRKPVAISQLKSALSPLLPFSPSPLLLFGGKGGVGKTTAASATALFLLDKARSDERILLVSTDPAHSLSDSLETIIGDKEVLVARRGKARLFAREIDTIHAFESFKSKHGDTLKEIADRGTLLDEGDINQLLDLSLPGMDEVMALFELSEINLRGNYSFIVLDTAPSGHTARLLSLPEVFTGWLGALDRLQEKHRFMVTQFVRGARIDEDKVEVFLRNMRERINRVREMLYDPKLAAFILVTIPEAMAVEETLRFSTTLKKTGVPVTDLIINRVEHIHESCRYCRARAGFQKPWLKQIEHDFDGLRIHKAALFANEVHGLKSLRQFARMVWEDQAGEREWGSGGAAEPDGNSLLLYENIRSRNNLPFSPSPRLPFSFSPPLPHSPARLLIFGGKGGVGKTTAAAAAAIRIAEGEREKRTLVFSTDPAHSLSDSFDERVGQLKRGVGGLPNLDAMEIDPARWFDNLKRRYKDWADEFFEALTAGSRWDIKFEREAMREAVELAPPGLDEIAALSHISDLIGEGRYDRIVLDTAPTGHLIRFLELPDVALTWTHTLIKLLLKYKEVARWSEIAEEMVALSKSIKRVIVLLRDKNSCSFITVAIAERMSLEESLRLSGSLRSLKIPVAGLLINNVVPVAAASSCRFCAARLRGQQKVIDDFRKNFKEISLIVAPQQSSEVRGSRKLRQHIRSWQRLPKTDEQSKPTKKK